MLASLPVVGSRLGDGSALKSMAHPAPASTMFEAATPPQPKMPGWRAHRELMKVPMIRDMVTSERFERHRHVPGIDPDIDVMRSFSRMAKITFQRQRNVQRDLEQCAEDPGRWSAVNRFLDKIMWGRP